MLDSYQSGKGCCFKPLADFENYRDVGEEVVVLCGRHRFTQCFTVLEVTHQDAQAV